MGYYSDLAIQYLEYDDDRSYPSPEQQLFWRLEDLQYKMEELIEKGAEYRGWDRLTDNDIHYAIPDYFDSVADVERTIELAIQDLKYKYNIDICEDTQNEVSNADLSETEVYNAKQISLFEILPMPPQEPPLKAA